MIPFLGIDLTTDKKNKTTNGSEFISEKPSLALAQALEHSTEKANQTTNKSKLPLPLRIIQYTCWAIWLIMISSIIRADVSVTTAYKNAPWVFWIGGITFVLWLILWLSGKVKSKSVLGKEESSRVFTHLESVTDSVYTDLSVPNTATDVNVLSFYYKLKDGNIKVCTPGMQIAPYLNPIFKAFSDSEYLYLADLNGKYAIPLSSIVSIKTVNKRIQILRWNKDVHLKNAAFKKYKLQSDNYNRIHCKYYHIVEFNHYGTLWGIYIPCYELPVFERLTGLKAQ